MASVPGFDPNHYGGDVWDADAAIREAAPNPLAELAPVVDAGDPDEPVDEAREVLLAEAVDRDGPEDLGDVGRGHRDELVHREQARAHAMGPEHRQAILDAAGVISSSYPRGEPATSVRDGCHRT